MLKLCMVLGTILATGWFTPAQAGQETDYATFIQTLCRNAMRTEEAQKTCVASHSAKSVDGMTVAPLASPSRVGLVLGICHGETDHTTGGEHGSLAQFMDHVSDCYKEGLEMANLPVWATDEVVHCADMGEFGSMISCYDRLIAKVEKAESSGSVDYWPAANADAGVAARWSANGEKIWEVSSLNSKNESPLTREVIQARVTEGVKAQEAIESKVGEIRDWTCKVKQQSSKDKPYVASCTVNLELPWTYCWYGHFVLDLGFDKLGNVNSTNYQWVE